MGGTLWVFKYLCERLWSKRRLGTCRVLPTHVNVLMTVFEKPSIRIKVPFPELSIDTFGVLCLTVTSVIKYCSTSNYYYLFMGFSNLLSEFKTLFYYEKTNNASIYLSQKSRSPTTTASPPRPPPIWAPFAAARSRRWFFTSHKTETVWSELRAFPICENDTRATIFRSEILFYQMGCADLVVWLPATTLVPHLVFIGFFSFMVTRIF